MKDVKKDIQITVNAEDLNITIEKANRLVEILREAQDIIDSTFGSVKRIADLEVKVQSQQFNAGIDACKFADEFNRKIQEYLKEQSK